jgi:hypothetical protein
VTSDPRAANAPTTTSRLWLRLTDWLAGIVAAATAVVAVSQPRASWALGLIAACALVSIGAQMRAWVLVVLGTSWLGFLSSFGRSLAAGGWTDQRVGGWLLAAGGLVAVTAVAVISYRRWTTNGPH